MNTIRDRSTSLLRAALACPSLAVQFVCRGSCQLAYTSTGYNCMYGHQHVKEYYYQDGICASIIRHLRLNAPFSDTSVNSMISTISSS